MVSKIDPKSKFCIENIEGVIQKTVTQFGTGAKVDCLKEYIGYPAYVIICKKTTKNTKNSKKD
jgi:putative transposon-encoded protein